MKYQFLAAVAAVAFSSAPALANTCYNETAAAIQAFGIDKKIDWSPTGVRTQIDANGPAAPAAFAKRLNVSAECRPHTAANVKAYAGLTQPSEPASQPAATSAPVNSTQTNTSAPAGGGAMLDAKDSELERKLAELERKLAAGGLDADSARQIRAEISSLRSEVSRLRSPTAVVRTVTVNQGPNPVDKARWDTAASQSSNNTGVLDKLLGYTDPKTGKEVKGTIGNLQDDLGRVKENLFGKNGKKDVITDHENRIAATEAKLSSWRTPQWWWFAILVGAMVLVALWLASRKQTSAPADVNHNVKLDLTGYARAEDLAGLATKEEVAGVCEELHERVDRVVEDVQLEPNSVKLLKIVKPGDEAAVVILLNGQPKYHGLTFIKVDGNNFKTGSTVGDTPADQEIGDVLAFVRRAYKRRRNDLESFLIKDA